MKKKLSVDVLISCVVYSKVTAIHLLVLVHQKSQYLHILLQKSKG